MKSVLISIQPKWCELIASGKKTVEVRKTRPKIETPFKCYIYCTNTKTMGDLILCKSKENVELFGLNAVKGINKGFAQAEDIQLKGKVIGEFVCDRIDRIRKRGVHENYDYCYLSLNVFGNDDIEIEIMAIKNSCIPQEELNDYGMYSHCLYAWHISDLVIYDEPKVLDDFRKSMECHRGKVRENCIGCWDCEITRPPQSWCYVEKGR